MIHLTGTGNAILLVALLPLLWNDGRFLLTLWRCEFQWETGEAKVLAAQVVRKPWHAFDRLKRPRYIAAVEFVDPEGRRYTIDRLSLRQRPHASARNWVAEHQRGDTVRIRFPSKRPDQAVILPASAMVLPALRSLGFIVVVIGAAGYLMLRSVH